MTSRQQVGLQIFWKVKLIDQSSQWLIRVKPALVLLFWHFLKDTQKYHQREIKPDPCILGSFIDTFCAQ